MAQQSDVRRGDIVEEDVIRQFVGRVEPGDTVSTAVVVWSVMLSIVLVLAASLWWSVH
ncbi:MAG TPA: hypothetical protein VFN36_03895 [Solirubrobacteraceae bacterium]|nr:hypothetical protein [Solirubrobacteraceae bacterium]